MHRLPSRLSVRLLIAASLAASGHAVAFEGAVDLASVSAGARPAGAAFGMPVSADALLASTASSGTGLHHAAIAPGAASPDAAALAPASVMPASVTVSPISGSGPSGLNAAVSITLVATSMRDAAGHAVATPVMPSVVTVSYSLR